MKKRKIRRFLLMNVLAVFLVLFVGYFLMALYYWQGFAVNTWINGVYCTGKSVEEVNSELLSQVKAPIVIITDNDGIEYEIDLADVGYQEDYMPLLQSYMKKQNPFLWIDNVIFYKNHELLPQVSYDYNALRQKFYELPPIQKEAETQPGFFLTWNVGTEEEGYLLHDNLHHRMDTEKVFQALVAAINLGETSLDLRYLDHLDCYYDVPMTAEQELLEALWEKIEAFQNCSLIYNMGAEQIRFTPAITSGLLACSDEGDNLPILDENGGLVLDCEAVEAFVADLAADYDTYGKERQFYSNSRGEYVTVKSGTYGTTLNQKAEVEYLMENLLSEELHSDATVVHVPEYKREAYVRGLDDIGGTYIEIDMTAQKLYCYVDRELQVETDVVTGNMRRKMSTPPGIYYVYNKQKDRILRGEGYASPVDYWMPVNRGIGIHDADWRKEFGGEIYQKNGSHGCVNVPPKVMPELYEMVEIGTPVIMYY